MTMGQFRPAEAFQVPYAQRTPSGPGAPWPGVPVGRLLADRGANLWLILLPGASRAQVSLAASRRGDGAPFGRLTFVRCKGLLCGSRESEVSKGRSMVPTMKTLVPIPARRRGETDARWLARIIAAFPEELPISGRLGSDDKEHWLGWLSGYYGPGYYGRSDAAPRTLRAIYNRFNCGSALIYLAEGLGCRVSCCCVRSRSPDSA